MSADRAGEFAEGLRGLGYTPELRGQDLVVFDYAVEVGPLVGQAFKIGLRIGGDWPLNPPGGPITAPRFLPINPSQERGHPFGGVHENNELGEAGHYLSRPFRGWSTTDRTVSAYMGHVRHLFDTLPSDLAHANET